MQLQADSIDNAVNNYKEEVQKAEKLIREAPTMAQKLAIKGRLAGDKDKATSIIMEAASALARHVHAALDEIHSASEHAERM